MTIASEEKKKKKRTAKFVLLQCFFQALLYHFFTV